MHHQLYMAPMLGITDSCFRTAFNETIGGLDGAISPFVRTLQGQRFKVSHFNDLEPNLNRSLEVVPQVLTNNPEDFIHSAKLLFDMGYATINLNMGCPVPTSAGRGRGAGLIPEVELVDRLLETVIPSIPNRLSIKTRIGYTNDLELVSMMEVFNRFPLSSIILHPRTAAQKYNGFVNHEVFAQISQISHHPMTFSGDINSKKDIEVFQARHPKVDNWMIGRGLLRDPLFIPTLKGQPRPQPLKLVEFYSQLNHLYQRRGLSQHIIATRLKTLFTYLSMGREIPKKHVKAVRKAKQWQEWWIPPEMGYN